MFNFHTHTHQANSICNIDSLIDNKLIEQYYYSIGNHPWYNNYTISEIENLILNHKNIISIGECGIDKLRSNKTITEQIDILTQQVKLSEQLKLPLTLHIVKGFNEIIKLKKDLKPTQNWIIHGFNNYKQGNELLTNGFYLSFGKALLKNTNLQKVFIDCSIQKIVLETDDSDISIEKMYNFAAQLKGISVNELTQHIRQNLNRITNGKLA